MNDFHAFPIKKKSKKKHLPTYRPLKILRSDVSFLPYQG